MVKVYKSDELNLNAFVIDALEAAYYPDQVKKREFDRLRAREAGQKAMAQHREDQDRRQVEADKEAAAEQAVEDRSIAVRSAVGRIIDSSSLAYLERILPQNDPSGDYADNWEDVVSKVSGIVGSPVDSVEVIAAIRAEIT